uniref:Uncharacterized protein n=1 Tax=viral metagenome TaxID=1070528 RepID=A0A6C0JRR7_9ZZZZ
MPSNYYEDALTFVLDLMRRLSPMNNSTTIIFASEELEIYKKVCATLEKGFVVSIEKDNSLHISWGKGNLPTKANYFTPFYQQSRDIKNTKQRIKNAIAGKNDPDPDEYEFF